MFTYYKSFDLKKRESLLLSVIKDEKYWWKLDKSKPTLTHLTDIVVVAYVSSNDSVKQEDFLGTIGNSVFTVAAASVGDF